jgi:uncharacterized damage-inducible protein DinB
MLIEAFQYKHWADQRTLDAISRVERKNFPRCLEFAYQQLNHMIRVEELFRARLDGVAMPHSSTNTDSLPELAELTQRITVSNQWFAHYAENLVPEQRKQFVLFQFVDGKSGAMTRLEIMFHVINHGTYHRGAIGHALDLARVPHPADTYSAFIHAIEPLRRLLS